MPFELVIGSRWRGKLALLQVPGLTTFRFAGPATAGLTGGAVGTPFRGRPAIDSGSSHHDWALKAR